jgi:hypothetical protein
MILESQGQFWASGEIVTRTLVGTTNKTSVK